MKPLITFAVTKTGYSTDAMIKKMLLKSDRAKLDEYGKMGVEALARATPVDTGKTSASWNYEIHSSKGVHTLTFTNSNLSNYIPVVILIQYGHATKNGGFVQGRDFINPAIEPVFKKMSDDLWGEVLRV